MRIRFLVVVMALMGGYAYPQDPTCYKCCGYGFIYDYGHRACNTGDPNTCHVTQCTHTYSVPQLPWCCNGPDYYVDVCGAELGSTCRSTTYHGCGSI
jgi:hypothetical protein